MAYSANEQRYQQMQYRRCGKSGIQLSALSLGLWHNFGDVDDEAVEVNAEEEQTTLLGDMLTMSWNSRKVKLDHDYSIIGWALSIMPEVYKDA